MQDAAPQPTSTCTSDQHASTFSDTSCSISNEQQTCTQVCNKLLKYFKSISLRHNNHQIKFKNRLSAVLFLPHTTKQATKNKQ